MIIIIIVVVIIIIIITPPACMCAVLLSLSMMLRRNNNTIPPHFSLVALAPPAPMTRHRLLHYSIPMGLHLAMPRGVLLLTLSLSKVHPSASSIYYPTPLWSAGFLWPHARVGLTPQGNGKIPAPSSILSAPALLVRSRGPCSFFSYAPP